MRKRETKKSTLSKSFPRYLGLQSRVCLVLDKLGFKSMSYLQKQEHINLKGKITQHLTYLNKRTYWIYLGDNPPPNCFHQLLKESLFAITSITILALLLLYCESTNRVWNLDTHGLGPNKQPPFTSCVALGKSFNSSLTQCTRPQTRYKYCTVTIIAT